jgi:hypothetical protein
LDPQAALDEETVKAEIRTLLADAEKREFVMAEDFEAVTGDIISGERRRAVSAVHSQSADLTPYMIENRESFHRFLSTKLSALKKTGTSMRRQYNALSARDRKLFELTLSVPGLFREASDLPGLALLNDMPEQRASQREAQRQIAAYISVDGDDQFSPQINYSVAVGQLQTADGKFDQNVFEQAMQFTRLCIQRRQSETPKDWNRLADPLESLAYKHGRSKLNDLADTQPDSREAFIDAVRAIDERAARNHLNDLTEGDGFALFIHVLQDRTVLDRSTGVKGAQQAKGELYGFANEEKRADIRERYLAGDASFLAPDTASMQRALLVLRSFQLRDDVNLRKRNLRKTDFADGALDRKEALDIGLLQRARDFVREMQNERVRLLAMGRAPEMIADSGNEKAQALYGEKKDAVNSEAELESLLVEQAKEDKQSMLLAGYFILGPAEKALLVKALGQRDILDVSKQDINLNRVGLAERDFANPRGRDALTEQYVNLPESIQTTGADFAAAFQSCMSSQVSDRASEPALRHVADGTATEAERREVFASVRDTAVDWKLFGRALQFVRRSQNERNTFLQDRELYRSQGDVAAQGQFRFNAHYMRRNVHNSGNRVIRHIFRRLFAELGEQIPGPVAGIARRLMPADISDTLNSMEPFRPHEEEQNLGETVTDYGGIIAGLTATFAGNETVQGAFDGKNAKAIFGTSLASELEAIGEYSAMGAEILGAVNTGLKLGKAVKKQTDLADAREESARALEEDAERTAEAAPKQTEEEHNLAWDSIARNIGAADLGMDKAGERISDDIINSLASLLGVAVDTAAYATGTGPIKKVLTVAIKEAGEFVNFLRSYFNDKASVRKYFEHDTKVLSAYRESLKTHCGMSEEEIAKIDVLDLARSAFGFEDDTETASYVGLNITRSILFSTGKQNPLKSTRVQMLAVLAVLGCTGVAGKEDDASAVTVYNAIMGNQYR